MMKKIYSLKDRQGDVYSVESDVGALKLVRNMINGTKSEVTFFSNDAKQIAQLILDSVAE